MSREVLPLHERQRDRDRREQEPVEREEAPWPGKRATSHDIWTHPHGRPTDVAMPRGGVGAPVPNNADPEEGSPAAIVRELGDGHALDSRVAASVGEAYGTSFAHVRIHTDDTAARLTAAEGAHAFTIGEHIAFAPGAYQPGTVHGDALIAHELAHVVQQQHLGPAALQRKKIDEDGSVDAAETEADQAAQGFLSRAYGGLKTALRSITQLPTKMVLRRCPTSSPSPAMPADPLFRALYAKLTATPPDVAGFYGDIAALNGSRAGDGVLRSGFQYAISHGKLSYAQAFRAVAFQEYGPVASWPLPVKNFADGVDAGTNHVTALPPAGRDALREHCVRESARSADGSATVTQDYRNEFNARFDSSRFSALSSDFDPTLDSKGPRTRRARAVFSELYADPRFRTAYDTNTPPGFREVCDTTVGPDGTNLIASPRLQALRARLAAGVVTAASTSDPLYTALVAAVTPLASALDPRDRQELERNHSWRLAVDNAVTNPAPVVAQALRDDLWRIVTTSRSPAAAGPVAPVGPGAPTATAPPAPTPNAAQTAFLHSIHLTAPASPIRATVASQALTFRIRGNANPALAVNRRVVVEPAAQVIDGGDDESPWPSGATAVDHTVHVDPQPAAGPSTVFTARLTMPPLATSTFAEQTATVTVEDKRLDWFRANLQPGLTYIDDTDPSVIGPGGAAHYTGKQCPIDVAPNLNGTPNPGLDVQVDGELKKGAAVVHALPRRVFERTADNLPLFQTILPEPSPPPATPEAWSLVLRAYQGTGAVAVHTITLPFTIARSRAGTIATDTAHMAVDNAWLNAPIATAGHLLHHMNAMGGNHARVARAVAGGALRIAACFMRSDSADAVTALGGSTTTQVAYAMGVVDPIGTATNTLVAQPGAAGWRWGAHPNTVYLNASPHPGGARRSLAELADFLAHEGIHAADRTGSGSGDWESYVTEFRAYWIMGTGAGSATAFDPTMSGIGPKAPRARVIFEHLYGNSTYPFVKPAYDANAAGFRERADNYLFPDGINLALSPQLADLRAEIEGYTGAAGTFPAKRAAVSTKYTACPPGDKNEVHNNRDWRDLVEQKFAGAERTDIKTLLGIPQ